MNEIKYLSYSKVRCYLECPRLFEYRYLKQMPAVLNGRMLAGRAYHHGVEYALKRKKEGWLTAEDEVKDIINDRWEAEMGERLISDEKDDVRVEAREVDWANDDPGKLKDTVVKLGALYVKKTLPEMEPVAVEKKLTAEIAGLSFLGYADVILPGPGVVDHKFAQRKTNQEAADKDLQFSAYAALLGKPIWAAFHQALDQAKLDIHVVNTTRNKGDIEWFTHLVARVYPGMISGVYPPNPLTWQCGKRCSYYLECRVLMED
jgi:hypothetical protein